MADPLPSAGRRRAVAVLVGSALGAVALALTLNRLSAILPMESWWGALAGSESGIAALVFANVAVPRILVSWLAGAGLAMAGVLFQQALRNPLAEATTLGVSSGAYLALAAASLFAPVLMDQAQDWVALAGGMAATALVLGLSWRTGFLPASLILAGLTISLLCGATGAVLTLLNHDSLSTLFVWQTGSLVQNGWGGAFNLAPRLAFCALATGLLVRLLVMLELDDGQASALGVPVQAVRGLAVLLAVAASAFTVSAVGVIGFVGLAAPHLVRFMGARTFGQRLLWAPVAGGLLLWLTDQLVQINGLFNSEIPTGSAAGLLGAPMLLWMLARHRAVETPPPSAVLPVAARAARPNMLLLAILLAFVAAILVGLSFGQGVEGWLWLAGEEARHLLPWRWPRVAAAAAAGAMLAVSGTLLQRMTGNPMAGPEVLGVSSGAALGVIVLLLRRADFSQAQMLAAAFAGALATLGAVLLLGRSSDFAPNRLLLTGVALATVFSAFAALLLTSGDPRTAVLLTWMSGSTYRVTAPEAEVAVAAAILAIGVAPLTARWLLVLPFGGGVSRSLGVPVAASRSAILVIAALLTGAATLIVGPLSFVGLMAPHMARALGLQRPVPQILASAALGGTLLTMADWAGRNLLFPWQIPAGLVATLIGGPLFFWMLGRTR